MFVSLFQLRILLGHLIMALHFIAKRKLNVRIMHVGMNIIEEKQQESIIMKIIILLYKR